MKNKIILLLIVISLFNSCKERNKTIEGLKYTIHIDNLKPIKSDTFYIENNFIKIKSIKHKKEIIAPLNRLNYIESNIKNKP